jgi:hypothetical protein
MGNLLGRIEVLPARDTIAIAIMRSVEGTGFGQRVYA